MQPAPNILFLFPDQWRWDWLGHHDGAASPYGDIPVRTPNLDALAARGTRYTQCRTNSPLCAPARACLAQGLRYERCGVPSNGHDTPGHADTVFKRLRGSGYRTAITGKADLQKHGGFKGLDGWTRGMGRLGFTDSTNQCGKWDAINSGSERPADPYMASLHSAGLAELHVADYAKRNKQRQQQNSLATWPSPLPREHCTDDFCGAAALRYLQTWPQPDDRAEPAPWMLWVNFPGPHEPFDPPAQLQQRYDGIDFPPPVAVPDNADPQDHQQLRRNYAAMCEGIDEWVGKLLAAVEARGETDRTLVVFASDHGELLGDHGRWYKNTWHEGSVHVPLILAGSGVAAGQTRDQPVELIDIAATMLDAAGQPTPDAWDARSLLTAEPRQVQHAALGSWRMVSDGRHKLVIDGEDTLLFDLDADPAETQNLADTHPDQVTRLRQHLQ
jgi:arylsulfatase A-like enzyme